MQITVAGALTNPTAGHGAGKLSRIRVRLTSLLLLATETYAFIAALIFSLMVVRRLNPHDYGLWATILSIYNMLLAIPPIWLWWIARYTFYGDKKASETGFALSFFYALISSLLLVALGYYYDKTIGNALFYFILSTVFIVLGIIAVYIQAIVRVLNPAWIAANRVIYETTRVVAGYTLIIKLGLGLLGVIASFTIALVALLLLWGIPASLKLGVSLRPAMNHNILTKLKNVTPISFMGALALLLRSSDRALATAITKGTLLSAYLGVAYIPRSVVVRAVNAFTAPLYAKALRKPSQRDLLDVILLFLALALPALSATIVYRDAIILVINPKYRDASTLIVVSVLSAIVFTLFSILASFATGSVRVDEHATSLSEIKPTPLYKVPRAHLMRSILAVALYTVIISVLASTFGPSKTATLIVLVDTMLYAALTMYVSLIVREQIKTSDKGLWRQYLVDYGATLLASLLAAITWQYMKPPEPLTTKFMDVVAYYTPSIMPGLAVYLAVLTLSPRVRELARKATELAVSAIA